MNTVIKGIQLFPKQAQIVTTILNSNCRYITLNASRQFSKSTILENILMYRAINIPNSKLLYITPTYSLSKIVMNKLYQNLAETQVIKSFNKSDNLIVLTNNSQIFFRSATNVDTIRGLSVNYLFVDEASFMADNAWNVMRPTLNVIGRQAILASTPRGKSGFFYQSCQLGQSDNPNYLYLFGHYKDNPYYSLVEVEDAKKTLPENVFKQEYDGEFLDDGGSVFRNITNCAIVDRFKFNKQEGPYSIGIDLGRQQDWTVVVVLNRNKEVVEIYRDNHKDWNMLINSINSVIKKYPGAGILCETSGIGDVVFDLLKKTNSNIRSFVTTNESKNEIIEELIYAFETNSIKIPNQNLFPYMIQELNSYTFTYSVKTRRIMYNAITGLHDDCVMALAIALKAKKRASAGGFAVI